MSYGTLYGVGVGPGDPDLLTVKAVRIIGQVPIIAVPVATLDGDSYAHAIAAALLNPSQHVEKLHFPMLRDKQQRITKRREAAQQVATHLKAGQNVAFLTEGDPLLHSTFGYLLEHLPSDIPIEIVPGITSMLGAAADYKQSLVMGDERLAILPATFEEISALSQILAAFDTVVLLKIHNVLDTVLSLLGDLQLLDQAVVVERASHPEGRVFTDVATLHSEQLHYLSLMIIYSRRCSE